MTSAQSVPSTTSPTRQFLGLLGSGALCFAAAGLGGAATASALTDWYPTLAKPSWNPPNWVFGPVWTVLYLMMAVAAWLVWRSDVWPRTRTALSWFGGQLALNVGWSVAFFGLHSPGLACVIIVALWLAIVATALRFWPISRAAALLLAPYLAWTTFAMILNLAIWGLNR